MNIPVGYCQVNHRFGGTALPRGAEITYGLKLVDPDAFPPPDTLALALGNALKAAFEDLVASLATFEWTKVKYGPNETGLTGFSADGSAGNWVEDPDSPQVAVLINKTTALGGRVNRGRWFFPGVAEVGTISGGRIAPATITTYNTALDDWMTAVNGTTNVDGIYLLHSNPEVAPTEIVSMTCQGIVATQRRRLRKVGGRRRIIV